MTENKEIRNKVEDLTRMTYPFGYEYYMEHDFKGYRENSSLKPGNLARIEYAQSTSDENVNIDAVLEYVSKPVDKLLEELKASVLTEKEILLAAAKIMENWEPVATKTRDLKDAICYLAFPESESTHNEAVINKDGWTIISNKTYEMRYKLSLDNKVLKGELIDVWRVQFKVLYNHPSEEGKYRVDQFVKSTDRTRYRTKEPAEEFLNGLIEEYSYLFKEEWPPVPKERAKLYSYRGILLPGYRLKED